MEGIIIKQQDYENFSRLLQEVCGIVLGENRHYLVSSRLGRLMQEHSIRSLGELVENLKINADSRFLDRIVDAMTTNETSWFRDSHPFDALAEIVFPRLGAARAKDIRIWSAACSSGQEPYSISIAVQEFLRNRPGVISNVQIVATDISPAMLKVARDGIYDRMSLARGLSQERLTQHFRAVDDERWKVKNEIQSRVLFRELNLLKGFAALGKYDCIFCRNVLIYFSPAAKIDILERMKAVLNPGGYLVLGGSESIATYSDSFETLRFKSGLIYRLKIS